MSRIIIAATVSLAAASWSVAVPAPAPIPTKPPASSSASSAPSARWPLVLRDGLPAVLFGWTPAPTDPLPDEGENGMGHYTEVSRFFQKIESPTSTKQFQVSVQDYGANKDVVPELRRAVAEAAKAGVETRELDVAGHRGFVVTDKSTGKPITIVTVVLSSGRLVLGAGSNVAADEAVMLVKKVDFSRVAAAR